jgi:hypothetical protein
MSDGPWKTLKMSEGWRSVAKLAEMAASSPEEIIPRIESAITKDLREISRPLILALRQLFGEDQQVSLPLNEPQRFAALRAYSYENPLGALLISYACMLASEGWQGTDGAREAVTRTVKERISCAVRQIDEHHHRESGDGNQSGVGECLIAGTTHVAFEDIANRLLGIDGTRRRHDDQRFRGVDDGPRL